MRLRPLTALLLGAGLLYALFALASYRLAVVYDDEVAVSIGEGTFTLLGAAAFFAAVLRPGREAAIVALGTLPLVGWFVATPWNSGPPFLIVSAIAPTTAMAALLRRAVAGSRPRT